MADMIIKPSSGNSLVFQDEGGDAALTVATNGTTTFAENATLSGSGNNLGTVTAGTIGTGVTFPAGHVVAQALIQDRKAYNAHGGTFTAGDWRLRDLNDEVFDPENIVSISSNKFTLIAGSYIVQWQCPMQNSGYSGSKLWNETDSAYPGNGYGTSSYTDSSVGNLTTGHTFGCAIFTISGSKEFGVYHYQNTTSSSWGFGAGFDTNTASYTHSTQHPYSVFTQVLITKYQA